MIIIGIVCLIVALISALRGLSGENKKWEKTLAIIFLVLGIIILAFSLIKF